MLFLHDEEGQSLVEYGMILILVAIVVVGILTLFGDQLGNMWNGILVDLGDAFS